jgi:hypothetical protein
MDESRVPSEVAVEEIRILIFFEAIVHMPVLASAEE